MENMKILVIIFGLTVPFTFGGKPIQGIIIGSSDNTDGFPSYDYYLDPPLKKNQRNNKNAPTFSSSYKQTNIKDGDRISHITLTKQVPYPVPQPVPYPVYKNVPYPVKVEVPVKIDQPYEVKVYKPYAVRVDKPVPYQVIKNVPVPVKVPVNVPVPIKIPVLVPQPYPVKITKTVPVPDLETIIVKKPVLVYISGDGKTEGESDITEDGGPDNNENTELESDDLNCNAKRAEDDKGIQILTRYGYSPEEINKTVKDGIKINNIRQYFKYYQNQPAFTDHQNQQALKYGQRQQDPKDRRTPQTFFDQENRQNQEIFKPTFEDCQNQQLFKDRVYSQTFENHQNQQINEKVKYDSRRTHQNQRNGGVTSFEGGRRNHNGKIGISYDDDRRNVERKRNGTSKIPRQNFGGDKVIVFMTDVSNRNLIEGKRKLDSVPVNVSQNFGVNAQFKTIQTYLSKSEEPISQTEGKGSTHNIKEQRRNGPENSKNSQNPRNIKLIPDGNNNPRKNSDAEKFFRNSNAQFHGSEFTGLGAYSTHSQGHHH